MRNAYGYLGTLLNRSGRCLNSGVRQNVRRTSIPIELPLSGYDGFLAIIVAGVTPVDLWGR